VVHDFPEDLLVHAIEFARRRCVDRIEQQWEGIAEAEAAPAPMTEVVDALEFLEERLLVEEIGVAPGNRVPRGCCKAAFATACQALGVFSHRGLVLSWRTRKAFTQPG
jgi:hypothetical protein